MTRKKEPWLLPNDHPIRKAWEARQKSFLRLSAAERAKLVADKEVIDAHIDWARLYDQKEMRLLRAHEAKL